MNGGLSIIWLFNCYFKLLFLFKIGLAFFLIEFQN